MSVFFEIVITSEARNLLLMRLDSGWGKQQILHSLKAVRDDNPEIIKRAIRMDGPWLRNWLRKQRSGSIPLHGESQSHPTGTVLSTCSRTSSSCLASAREVGRAMSSSSSMVLT